MKLSHCNKHLDITEERLCCMALRDDEGHVLSPETIWVEFQELRRDDEGRVLSPEAIWVEVQELRKENDELRKIISLGAEDGKRR